MDRSKQCGICGVCGGCGMMVMGQFICLDCQALLDDPKKRVFGCGSNLHFAKGSLKRGMELAKAKE